MRAPFDAERLRHFFTRLQSASSDPAGALARFFSDLKRFDLFARRPAAPPSGVGIDLSDLRTLFEALRPHANRLKPAGDSINIWRVAGLERDEVRNAAVLGWILDARQSHGYGASVLNALLCDLRRRQQGYFPVPDEVIGSYSVAREVYSFGDGQNRVDLMIDTQFSVIIIEVKIRAAERSHQVRDYLNVARERALNLKKSNSCVIYLTPKRVSANVADPRLVLCAWKDVARAIRSAVSRDGRSSFSARALFQLAEHFDQLGIWRRV